MAAATVMRLQTVVSREISPRDTAVVTVGRIEAGSKNNIIPESASLGLSVRSFSETVRERLVAGIQRVIEAEAAASNAPRPPKIEFGDRFPVTYNDPEITEELNAVFVDAFGEDAFFAPGALSGSEDVGVLATAAGGAAWVLDARRSGLRVKKCVWPRRVVGLDLAFLDAD